MNILVLGKNGQLGKALVDELSIRNLPHTALGHEELDISDFEKTKKILSKIAPSVIINASAFHVVSECEKDPQTTFLINATSVMKLAIFCKEKNIRFISYSSDYVFDGKKGEPYLENDVVNPLQVYGVSKLAGEFLSRNYNDDTVIIRTSGVYGGKRGSKAKNGNFILNLLRDAKVKKEIEVSSEQVVNTTYAVDLAKATLDLLKKKPKGGIYHLVNKGHMSWADFAKAVIDYSGLPTKIIPVDRGGYSSSAHRPVFSALHNKKAKELGVDLPTWKNALKRYIAYLQNQ